MKSRQFCSVCKEWLEMEVVPTSHGEEDDGVIWFRCPQCQGFLPKLSGADLQAESKTEDKPQARPETKPDSEPSPEPGPDTIPATSDSPAEPDADADAALPWDSPADMMAARQEAEPGVELPNLDSIGDDLGVGEAVDEKAPEEASETDEPLHQYAALLESKDQSDPAPYRPWETYEVGQCIHHQAWEDCGVVVAKEKLPGNRQVIKCYFKEAGVVRLIEMAPR
jgi:hypothetical protein